MKKARIAIMITFISLSLFAQNEIEPNNGFGNATMVIFSTTGQGKINEAFDEDYYKFPVTEPGIIKLTVLDVPGNLDIEAFIYNPDQEEIRGNANTNNGQAITLEVNTCQIGEHFILIKDGSSDFNNQEQYSFQIDFIPFSNLDNCECENESFGDACPISIDSTVCAIIAPTFLRPSWSNSPVQDEDYYSFNIPEPGIIKLTVLDVPGNLDIEAFIYNPNQEEIRGDANTNNGQAITLEVSTCQIGEHFVFIRDGSGADFNYEEQYCFKVDFIPFSNLDNCECENESFGDACPISIDSTVCAIIAPTFLRPSWSNSPVQDEDYYSFNIPEPGIIKLTVLDVPGNLDIEAFIYNPNQEEIRGDANTNNGQAITLEVSTCQIGEHFVFIRDGSGADFNYEEQYCFKVDFIPFSNLDNCECENESFGDACIISLCDTIEAIIAPWFDDSPNDRDEDFYQIELTSANEVDIIITSVPTNVELCVTIYDSIQDEIKMFSGDAGQPLNHNFTAPDAGVYYIKVEGCNSNYNGEDQYIMTVGCNLLSDVNDLGLKSEIRIYPNPFNENIIIEIGELKEKEVELNIVDLLGNKLLFKRIRVSNIINIDTQNLPKGLLIMNLKSGDDQYSFKVTKM